MIRFVRYRDHHPRSVCPARHFDGAGPEWWRRSGCHPERGVTVIDGTVAERRRRAGPFFSSFAEFFLEDQPLGCEMRNP